MKSTIYEDGFADLRILAVLGYVIFSVDDLAIDGVASNNGRDDKEDDKVDPGYNKKCYTDEFYFSAKHPHKAKDPLMSDTNVLGLNRSC